MAIPKTPEEEQQQVNEFKKSLESLTLEGFPDEVRKRKISLFGLLTMQSIGIGSILTS
jgi:hypothetical protein